MVGRLCGSGIPQDNGRQEQELICKTQNMRGVHIHKRLEGSTRQFKAQTTSKFSVSGGGVDMFDRSQAANVSPHRRLEEGSAARLASSPGRSKDLSKGAETQGQGSGAGPKLGAEL